MAHGNVYLMLCEHGPHRYFKMLPWMGLGCTREELPREVCMKAGVDPLHLVAFSCEVNMQAAASRGEEWKSGASH